MIPHQYALIAWIGVAFLLMADRNRARGFSIAMLGGLLVLPEARGVRIPGPVPDLGKLAIPALGVLAGTACFHFRTLLRFRPRWSDLLLVLLLVSILLTSLRNGLGLYNGLSTPLTRGLEFVLPIFLARVHLDTPKAVRTFLYTLVILSVPYSLMALWEFRMSPQFHYSWYGYYQHSFAQHHRGRFFRPLLFLSHGLAVGRLFACCAFLAALPLRRGLARLVPGGAFLFLFPSLGLLVSLSYGPWTIFLTLCGLYLLFRRWPWTLPVLPVAAFLWLAVVIAGARPYFGVADLVGKFNVQRGESLRYRFEALEDYRASILEQPILGHGGFGRGRVEGRATDSEALITSLGYGFSGVALYFGWWFWAMYVSWRLARRCRGAPFCTIALSAAALVAVGLAVSVIDVGLSHYVLLFTAGVLGVELTAMKQLRPRPAGAPRPPLALTPPGAARRRA